MLEQRSVNRTRGLSVLQAVDRRSVVDIVKDQILQMITEGEFRPGDKLPSENEFTDILQVSRSSVREALRILAAHGVIDRSAGVGYFVREMAPDSLFTSIVVPSLLADETLSYVQEVRGILEVHAIGLAATRATPQDLQSLDANLAAMQTESNYIELGLECHELILASAHNPVLESVYRMIVDLMRTRLIGLYELGRSREQVVEAHRLLVDAIKSRDLGLARHTMSAHLQEVSEILARALGGDSDALLEQTR